MRRTALLVLLPIALGAQAPEQLFQERRYGEARAAAQTRLAQDKNDATALYWMGRIAVLENKTGEAIDWFEKAVEREDQNATYHLWLGNALGNAAQTASKLRQPFLARRVKSEFERAVQLDPTLLDARSGLVDFYSMAPGFMGGSMEKAWEQAREITKLNAMQGHLAGARIATRQRDVPGTEREFQAALTAAPDSAQTYYRLANFYRRQSRWDGAMTTYDRLMKAKPDEIVAHLGWGAASAASGKSYDRGERELKFFLANAPKDMSIQNMVTAHFRLGQIYEKTSRRDLAKAEYAEALKINPQSVDAKKALDALK